MTVRFRTARYLVALLWHWSIPFLLGCAAAAVVTTQGVLSSVQLIDQSLDGALQRVVSSCITAAPETAEISGAQRSLFPLARGPTSPTGALALGNQVAPRPD
jgi:hypothetical protein